MGKVKYKIYKGLATTAVMSQLLAMPIMSHADTLPTNNGNPTQEQKSTPDNQLGKLNNMNLISDVEDLGEN
ncbi:hypothetical protein BK708_39560 [Bacillus thuringiensis serovar yunnanensis]|nr:hypothetical protein BK708_39560 [Bacillus thuringiensis serovar yunnanensis]